MRVRRSTAIQAGLGLAATVALGLALAGGYWLPTRARALDAEGRHLGARAAQARAADAAGTAHTADAVSVPAVAALPGQVAALLDAIAGEGAGYVEYTLGDETRRGPLAVRSVTVRFEAGVDALARVFARLEAVAPAVTLETAKLERSADGRVEAALVIRFLGAA